MTSTTAGEGTNSDGREVTMTDRERGRTGAEMTGTTGKTERRVNEGCRSNKSFHLNSLRSPRLPYNATTVRRSNLTDSFTSQGVGQGQGTAKPR